MKFKTFIIGLVAINVFFILIFLGSALINNNTSTKPNVDNKTNIKTEKPDDSKLQYIQRKGRLIHTGADFKRTHIVDISKDSNTSKVTVNFEDVANINRTYVFDVTNQKVTDIPVQDGKTFNFESNARINVEQLPDGKLRLNGDIVENGQVVTNGLWVLEEIDPQSIIEDPD